MVMWWELCVPRLRRLIVNQAPNEAFAIRLRKNLGVVSLTTDKQAASALPAQEGLLSSQMLLDGGGLLGGVHAG